MDNELKEILGTILDKIENLDTRLENLENGQENLENGQKHLEKELENITRFNTPKIRLCNVRFSNFKEKFRKRI